MALNDFLLEILVCPTSKQGVELASSGVVERVNLDIEAGGLHDVGGESVSEKVDALLIREDGAVGYPVRSGIPEMLVERGISMATSA